MTFPDDIEKLDEYIDCINDDERIVSISCIRDSIWNQKCDLEFFKGYQESSEN
ncbi:MAG: hypothetical protein LBF68_00695 [Christensenellaceae bacterium]|nr:hypothetical protein [Christensenellaceae bacterium]